eukprot:TRINITY_DN647_c0_g1_i2.p1 TRINITY_DN647_c0_g1~~TRINITY_DN647_c0_g1_i2.p1  ORF type:complete len:249 (-),score=70.19 TRINITY_DN647_c0_g1_i2:388-1134(-)
MARTPFVGGNWKMNGSLESTSGLADMLNQGDWTGVEVVVAPSSLHLLHVKSLITNPAVAISSQNIFSEAKGAYTGETSPDMLVDAGIPWTLLGHSERRHVFGETDEMLTKKATAGEERKLGLILCIGEQKDDRESGNTMAVCATQLEAFKAGVTDWSRVVIAYEPVWAIGTGLSATPAIAQDTHNEIRGWIEANVGAEVAAATRIIYGGSVNGGNCAELSAQPDIDGFLVGGAALKPEFATIISSKKQ